MNANTVRETAALRFGGSINYRLEADMVQLEADVEVCDAARAALGAWSLQFWTCGEGAAAVKIAELPFVPADVDGARLRVAGAAIAVPPAGVQAHAVGLRLSCRDAAGHEEAHDFASFARAENFLLPRLAGAVGYRFEGDSVVISADAVENPREAGNLSGTLSLELWALREAYQGGPFEGLAVAGAQLGALAGQATLTPLQLTLPAAPLPAGEWHLTLMLREWTPAGFVTRDFARFTEPYQVSAPDLPPAQAGTLAEPLEEPAARKPASRSASGRVKSAAPAAKTASLNRATLEELAAVKGISASLAAAILAGRPYASLDELLRVRGIGEKLLARLRPFLEC